MFQLAVPALNIIAHLNQSQVQDSGEGLVVGLSLTIELCTAMAALAAAVADDH